MAIEISASSTSLKLKVQTGVNATGNPVYALRSYNTVKPSAAHTDLFAVGQALAGLQKYPAVAIQRVDSGNLVNV